MNGVQTRFKCKLDVKRCKRFVFPPSSLLPRSNALKTKAIRYFQTDQTLTRIVSSPLKNPYASANYLMNKPHVLAHIKALLSSERFEMETMAVKLQVAETLKAVMDETATSDYTDRFGVPLSPAPLRAVSVNAAKALMDIFPIRHKEENRLRIEGSDGNVIFNVIVPQNPMTDGEKET